VPAGAATAVPCIARFSHCALESDWQLAWGALPLVKDSPQLPSAIATMLQLKSPPPFPAVLAHLQRVSAAPF
jgi:hypothetical protein